MAAPTLTLHEAEVVGDATMHAHDVANIQRLVMTDVSDYARFRGLACQVLFSPQVLRDIMDIPDVLKIEDNLTRVMRILGDLRNIMHQLQDNEVVEFTSMMPLGKEDRLGSPKNYEMIARAVGENSISVLRPQEETGVDVSDDAIEEVRELQARLIAPQPWWEQRITPFQRGGFNF